MTVLSQYRNSSCFLLNPHVLTFQNVAKWCVSQLVLRCLAWFQWHQHILLYLVHETIFEAVPVHHSHQHSWTHILNWAWPSEHLITIHQIHGLGFPINSRKHTIRCYICNKICITCNFRRISPQYSSVHNQKKLSEYTSIHKYKLTHFKLIFHQVTYLFLCHSCSV